MNSVELWERYKSLLWHDRELGMMVDVSRMPVSEPATAHLRPALDNALAAMKELETGGIANPDENRMVGHYWLRDPDLAPDAETGAVIRSTIVRVLDFAAGVHQGSIRPQTADRFTRFLLIGIGGSALGPQFVARALAGPSDALTPHFIDNTDPDGIDTVLQVLGDELATTLTIVVSKSGGTQETRNGMLEIKAAYERAGLAFGEHAVAVTGVGSVLETFAREQGFLDIFPMWDWVGGRTSVLSAVGLLPAALQGIDIEALLSGARDMDRHTRAQNPSENPAALLASAWHTAGNGRGARDMVVLPYKDRLLLLSRYLQQLVMESLGKERDLDGQAVHQGIVVYGNKGSTDQHAFVQQLRDGPDNFFVTFIEVQRDREGASLAVEDDVTAGDYLLGFLLGTRRALQEKGRGSITITIPEVSGQAIGALIALYERAVGLYATLVNINAYHQPGVEAGKKAAADVVQLQKKVLAAVRDNADRTWTLSDLAAHVGAESEIETLFKVLQHAAANPDHGIKASPGDPSWESEYHAG